MNIELYKMEWPDGVAPILKELQKRIAKVAGVTVVGNRLTVRWRQGGKLVQVHAVIVNIDDGNDDED